MTVAIRFGGEVGSECSFDSVDSRRGAGDRRKVAEMAGSESNDHEPFVVAGDEIDSVRAVDGVSAGLATATVHLYFGEVTEGSRGGQCDVFERSEEHTSELQSLMRNSYAVFCFKTNN